MEQTTEKKIVGNTCTFILFIAVNILLCLESVAVFSLGIYLWVEIGEIEVFSITFMCLGFIEFWVSFVGYKSRASSAKLTCYIFFLGIIFLCQVTATVMGLIYKDDLIHMVAEHDSGTDEEAIKKLADEHVDIVLYGTLSAVGVQFICLLFSICYRKSLKQRKADHYQALVDTKK